MFARQDSQTPVMWDGWQWLLDALDRYRGALRRSLLYLKPLAVTQAEEQGRAVVTLGRWYLVPEPDFAAPPDCPIQRHRPLESPSERADHTAEEFLQTWIQRPGFAYTATYVRGGIFYLNQPALELSSWHRVYRNEETLSTWETPCQD